MRRVTEYVTEYPVPGILLWRFFVFCVLRFLLYFRAVLAELADMEGGDAVGAGRGEELVSRLPGTPHYNSAILEDMCMKDHLAALHGICGDSEAFRDAVILGKVRLVR